jgi:His/Glu/Gln/Arg/opine family amino acid ABC transporter permease subunit
MLPIEWLTSESANLLVQGLVYTLLLTAITSVLSLVLGVSISVLRLSNRPIINRPTALYVEIFRNIPALVLISRSFIKGDKINLHLPGERIFLLPA